MSHEALVGLQVFVIVSEPWDFVDGHTTGPFLAHVLAVGKDCWSPSSDAVLIRLASPMSYKDAHCEYLIASPRYKDGDLSALAAGIVVHCGLTVIPPERVASSDPFDLSWWRGGAAFIGTLRSSQVWNELEKQRPDFYIASSDGHGMEEPRKAFRIKRLSSDTRDDLLLIRIDPPLMGQRYGSGGRDIEYIIIATRNVGATLFPIREWPVDVNVSKPLVDDIGERDHLLGHEYKDLAWAELYRTEEDARLKSKGLWLRKYK